MPKNVSQNSIKEVYTLSFKPNKNIKTYNNKYFLPFIDEAKFLENYKAHEPFRENRAKAIKDKTLYVRKGNSFKILGLTFLENPTRYVYIANGRETIGDIKRKFGIKDNAIREMQPWIKDDETYIPDEGVEIVFAKNKVY